MRSSFRALLAALALGSVSCDRPPVAAPAATAVAAIDAEADIRAGLPIQRPNFVVVLTDDQRLGDYAYMPKTRRLLGDRGVTFRRAYVPTPLCCPSRTGILRGQFSHNHGVLGNDPPDGGYFRFTELALESSTLATWLHGAGYRTTLIGKYLNGYIEDNPVLPPRPPGWTNWHPTAGTMYYGGLHIHDSTVFRYGERPVEDYRTDIETAEATGFIRATAGSASPFFIFVAPITPHSVSEGRPSTPAPRHAHLFAHAIVPRTPSFNEADISDKPAHMQLQAPMRPNGRIKLVDNFMKRRLEALQSVDEMVESIVATLDSMRLLDRTYIIFTTDNGFMLGEHRLRGKSVPYEEAVRVPLVIRGPRAVQGAVVDLPVLTIDLAPTIAALANISTPSFVDGRSLVPLLAGKTPSRWRRAVLLESWERFGYFAGLRTANYKYVEWYTGERELYDLRTDQWETENIWSTASTALRRRMTNTLAKLKTCAGAACRDIEATIVPEPPPS